MPRRFFPDWISSYVDLFGPRSEAPSHIHWWVACSMIGGACTRRIWIDEKTFRYYPNLFIVIVGPPAVISKSTVINLGVNILKDIPHIAIGADNTTYPAFIQDLSKRQSDIQDTFPDNDMDAEWIRQCAITLPISEFGTFFKPEEEDMVNGLTDLFDCRSIMVKDTKFAGRDVVEHPFVNLIACTTPDWIRDKLTSSIGGWGLSSRIIFLWADEKTRFIPRPSKLWKLDEFEKGVQRLTNDLFEISQLAGEITWSHDADELWSEWYKSTMTEIQEYNKQPDHNTWVSYFLGRKQVHIQKLAMILSVSRSDSLVITEQDLTNAIIKVNSVENEIKNIFTNLPQASSSALTEQSVLVRIKSEIMKTTEERILKLAVYGKVSYLVDSTTANRIVENAINRKEFKQVVAGGMTYLEIVC